MGRSITIDSNPIRVKRSPVNLDISFGKRGYVPSGGSEGQVLTRISDDNYTWKDNPVMMNEQKDLDELKDPSVHSFYYVREDNNLFSYNGEEYTKLNQHAEMDVKEEILVIK